MTDDVGGGGYNKKNCLWRHGVVPSLQAGAREDEYGEVLRIFAFSQKSRYVAPGNVIRRGSYCSILPCFPFAPKEVKK